MRRLENKTAPMFLVIGLGGLLVALVRELAGPWNSWHLARAGTILLFVLWLLLEAPVTLRRATGEVASADRGTVVLNAAARLVTAALALFVPSVWTRWNGVQTLGLLLFVAGFSFRIAAIRELGRFYSHKVRRMEGHQIVQTGPYRVVRHPAYLGMIAAHLGLVLVFLNVAAAVALTVLLVPAFVWRVLVEEREMMKAPEYVRFAEHRRRLLPLVW